MKRKYFCDGCINKEDNCKATCFNYKLEPSWDKEYLYKLMEGNIDMNMNNKLDGCMKETDIPMGCPRPTITDLIGEIEGLACNNRNMTDNICCKLFSEGQDGCCKEDVPTSLEQNLIHIKNMLSDSNRRCNEILDRL
jgi:hypothetical protein